MADRLTWPANWSSTSSLKQAPNRSVTFATDHGGITVHANGDVTFPAGHPPGVEVMWAWISQQFKEELDKEVERRALEIVRDVQKVLETPGVGAYEAVTTLLRTFGRVTGNQGD